MFRFVFFVALVFCVGCFSKGHPKMEDGVLVDSVSKKPITMTFKAKFPNGNLHQIEPYVDGRELWSKVVSEKLKA